MDGLIKPFYIILNHKSFNLSSTPTRMPLFTTTYAPKNSAQVFGQPLGVSQLKDFILNYKKQKNRAALIYGPIGNGKTSSVYALAQELKYDILEINSSDVRNEASMKSFLGAALGQQSLFFTPKLILIDEIDNISGREDRGCIPTLVSAIQKSSFPIILTANDPYDSKFKPLTKACTLIEFHKVDHKTIAHTLQWVCEQENIQFDIKAINTIARQVDGDVRGALLDLQMCTINQHCTLDTVRTLSDRKRTESIINALHLIFKSSVVENALPVLDDVDVDMNEVFLWLDENVPKEYLTPSSLAKAYEHLARADVFNGRIKRQQHWRFLVYISNLLTAGISSAKEEKNPNFVEYRPTMRILRLWQAKMKNAKKKEIAEKLGAATHTSRKVALEQVPYLQVMFQHGAGIEVAKELDLTEEEVEWLRK
ncbi:MAG: replication factor C large subunit [archaeon GW2011_AR9]|nr:MAG: replication factor C large subunit [archaeon GW2011_AR9]